MKCFQVELKYINANNQEVGVTIVSDPMPIGLSVNKDNENELVSNVLNYIYDNPSTTGHNELMKLLQETTNFSQVNINEQPLSIPTSNDSIRFSKLNAQKTSLIKSLDNASSEVKALVNEILSRESRTAFKINTLQIYGGVDPVSKSVVSKLDDFTKSSFYDKTNNTLFINATIDTPLKELELKEALLNSLLPSNMKSIGDIANTEDSFDPTTLQVNSELIPFVLRTVTSIKNDLNDTAKLKRTNAHNIKTLEGKDGNVNIYDNGTENHYDNPYKDKGAKANLYYKAWLNGVTIDGIELLEPKRQKWVAEQIEKGLLRGKNLLSNIDFKDDHGEILRNHINEVPILVGKTYDNLINKDSIVTPTVSGTIVNKVNLNDLKLFLNKFIENPLGVNNNDIRLLSLFEKYKGSEITMERLIKEVKGDESTSEGVEVELGDIVRYAGNEYLFWKLNPSGKARLLSSDGKKYSGTPNLDKLELVRKNNPFTFKQKDYVKYGGTVFSLSSGSKIKSLAILKQATINEARLLSIRKETPFLDKNTYPSDQTIEFDNHVKLRARLSDTNTPGVVKRFNDLEARIARNNVVSKMGADAVSEIRSRVDSLGRNIWDFTIYAPKKSNRTKAELETMRERQKQHVAIVNNTLAIESDWHTLTDEEKAVLDKDRYEEELNSIVNYFYDERVDPLIDNYFQFSDQLTATSVLEELGKTNDLAKQLHNAFKENLGELVIHNKPTDNLDSYTDTDETVLGAFITGGNGRRIEIAGKAKFKNGSAAETILHEVLHAITYDKLRDSNSEVVQEFEQLYQEILPRVPNYHYAMTNLDEFLVGIFTDVDFKKELMSHQSDIPNKTLWDKILDFVVNLFNFESLAKNIRAVINTNYSRNENNSTLYDKAFEKARNVLREVQQEDVVPSMPRKGNYFKKSLNSSYGSTNSYLASIAPTTRMNADFNKTKADFSDFNSRTKLRNFSKLLEERYDLEIEHLNSNEIATEYTINGFSYAKQRAFIDGTKIVINTDYATFAEPIHEVSHLILDGLKLTNGDIYKNLLNVVKTHPVYEYVRKTYSDLDADSIAEEAFVTILGERYNGAVASDSAIDWENQNLNFFQKAVNTFKNYLRNLFGIDSHGLTELTNIDFMNTDLNTILDKFSNGVLKGDFIKEVDLAKKKAILLENNEYLNSELGRSSSLFTRMRSSSYVSEDLASRLWMASKTDNFYNWHKGTIIEEYDGEPRIFFRGESPHEVYSKDVYDNGDMVVVKGELEDKGNNVFGVAPTNVKSVYNLDNGSELVKSYDIESLAADNKISMIGTRVEMNNSIAKLKDMFKDYDFSINVYENINFISYGKKAIKEVADVREQLLKHYSKVKC